MKLLNTGILAAILFISGCASPRSPALLPFGDNKFWITVEEMSYTIGQTKEKILIPKGFVTDFASTPWPLPVVGLSSNGQYSRAAIIHDYLYWSQGCSREQADRLLLIAMKESNVGNLVGFIVYQGVNLGGAGSWAQNTREKAAGLPRVIPDKYQRPQDPNMEWPPYRKILADAGVEDPPFEKSPNYCKYGNSTSVPENDT
ncbi:hypothetical protein BJP27_02490 [Pseudomonas oryzihabitans]|nr:hypothetical protein BJP27_02490 [Pseudomonas psychrotolerans]